MYDILIQYTKAIKDLLFFPIRVVLPNEQAKALGLTSLREERINIVLKHCRGKVLDIGCGPNHLIKTYRNGIGVDAFLWKGVDLVCDGAHLPFGDQTFDRVTFVASLNHIPDRIGALQEAYRVSKKDGLVLVTMINPLISAFGHKVLWGWWDPDQRVRGMEEGEVWGFWSSEIQRLFKDADFELIEHVRFVYGLNNLYIGKKELNK